MISIQSLIDRLHQIDGKGYKAYKDIRGAYNEGAWTLFIDYVQGDPFAAPSAVRVRVSQEHADWPTDWFATNTRRHALEDLLARRVAQAIGDRNPSHRGSGKSGLISIDAGNQEVLQRTAIVVCDQWVEARMHVGLPASGRRVRGRQAIQLLTEDLLDIAEDSLLWQAEHADRTQLFLECIENQEAIRAQLEPAGLVAFVANGAHLPRRSGASDRPLPHEDVVPFQSPPSLEVSFAIPNPIPTPNGETNVITGMGIPEGVTLIVGGGYHGKSTVLQAIERCVYPHVPRDGRELVVTRHDASKIRAEDGRRVESVDIRGFIDRLPQQKSTRQFCSDDASGSTSQAANIIEALEAGSRLLLLDEDTSATNFMIRDARMQALIHPEDEPITPFLDRVRELYTQHNVSSILVIGGSGDYFDVADTVIAMREYLPHDVTHEAKAIAASQPTQRQREAQQPLSLHTKRCPQPHSFDPSRGRKAIKINARERDHIQYGEEDISLRCVEQLADRSQTQAIGYAIHYASQHLMDGQTDIPTILAQLDALFEHDGLDALAPFARPGEHPGKLARPRTFEIAAAINRLRTLRIKQIT